MTYKTEEKAAIGLAATVFINLLVLYFQIEMGEKEKWLGHRSMWKK